MNRLVDGSAFGFTQERRNPPSPADPAALVLSSTAPVFSLDS